jgi:hypothetical protein
MRSARLSNAVLPCEVAPGDIGSSSTHAPAVATALQFLHLEDGSHFLQNKQP